ncbi:hypothetical protein NE237_028657 [Protea cynaroides]|uniref:Uncharacterized protein n=1 Tax=Protea cynaroides TaxID=273540 RepID=A0A9Q0GQR5_9MAGN|nr:hypothetical protein NE237_028657 [Protea cynaroides]
MEYEDLGRFLSFPTLETRSIKEGISSEYPVIDVGGDKARVQRRKKRKWLVKEKGKGLISDDPVVLQNDNVQQRGSREDPVTKSGVGGQSYAQVTGGLPDLTSLQEPVVMGGVTRVVLPQELKESKVPEQQRTAEDGFKENEKESVPPVHSEKPMDRWGDVSDDGESGNEEEDDLLKDGVTEEIVDRTTIALVNDVVQSVLVDTMGSGQHEIFLGDSTRAAAHGAISKKTNVEDVVMDQGAIVPVHTVTDSPGATAVMDVGGRIEMVFADVMAVDEALKEAGGEFNTVSKRLPSRLAGCGNKKAEIPYTHVSHDVRQSRHANLRTKAKQ